ncbi:hypothetical protein RB200_34470 [Streptomyces sp. PmtG]
MIKHVAVGVAAAALCAFGGGVALADTGGNGTAHAAGSHSAALAAPSGQGSAAGSGSTADARESRLSKASVGTLTWFEKPRPSEL